MRAHRAGGNIVISDSPTHYIFAAENRPTIEAWPCYCASSGDPCKSCEVQAALRAMDAAEHLHTTDSEK